MLARVFVRRQQQYNVNVGRRGNQEVFVGPDAVLAGLPYKKALNCLFKKDAGLPLRCDSHSDRVLDCKHKTCNIPSKLLSYMQVLVGRASPGIIYQLRVKPALPNWRALIRAMTWQS